tara:strand:- start:299 stop:1162 length:864 start_codon:yes stop_codon:yes gene_type:complete
MKKPHNNVAVKNPELAKEWHPTKNGDLTPYNVTPGSDRKVWWICSKNKDHEWISTVNNRNKGRGCPHCSGKKVGTYTNLVVKNPELAKEWHPTKNGDLTPYDVFPNSHKQVWWKCSKGHEWSTVISSRNRGNGCPYCAGRNSTKEHNLAVKNPKLAKEWHPTKNRELTPYDVTPNSGRNVWWQCSKNKDHKWVATIVNRNRGKECPFCIGKKRLKEHNLAVKNPELAKEWHSTKNGYLTTYDVTPSSNKKVFWQCRKCGSEWNAQISNRTRGTKCPYCSRKKRRKKD